MYSKQSSFGLHPDLQRVRWFSGRLGRLGSSWRCEVTAIQLHVDVVLQVIVAQLRSKALPYFAVSIQSVTSRRSTSSMTQEDDERLKKPLG